MVGLTQEYATSLLSYRDGNLFWKVSKGSRAQKGDLAGTVTNSGYRQIQISNKLYYAHRLIFLFHYGYLPKYLDHIDGNPLNNNISNLREATNQENHWNQKKTKSHNGRPTTSEHKGVSWNKEKQKWQVYITIDGKNKNLGCFTSEIKAAKVYNEAATKLFGEFACVNTIDKVSNGSYGFDSCKDA